MLEFVGGAVVSFVCIWLGSRLSAREADRLGEQRRIEEREHRTAELKAAARLVLAELGTAAVAAESAVKADGSLFGLRRASTAAWAAHGPLLAAELPAELYDPVAEACIKLAATVRVLADAPLDSPELLAQYPETRASVIELGAMCRAAQDALHPFAYPEDAALEKGGS